MNNHYITSRTAPKLNSMVTKRETAWLMGKMNLGMYTFYWTIFLSWLPLVLLFFFSCGLGLLLSALAVYFRDMMHLYSILTMGWMYATPLFYPITALPETLQKLMKLNPLYHYINLFRNLMMYGNIPGPNTWIACIFCAVASMAIGLLVFRKLQKNFILYI